MNATAATFLATLVLLANAAPSVDAATSGPLDVRVSPDLVKSGAGAQRGTQANPQLAVDPAASSRLAAVYEEAIFADGGARAIAVALSTNGGAKWKARLLRGLTKAAAGPFERAASPVAAFGPSKRLYVAAVAFDRSSSANGVFVASSRDSGKTFGAPVAVHRGLGEVDSQVAIAVDMRDDSPWRGRLYVCWVSVQGDGTSLLGIATSDDGVSFTAPVTHGGGAEDGGLLPLVGPGGVADLYWLHRGHTSSGAPAYGFARVRSTDGGASWSSPVGTVEVHTAGVPGMQTAEGLPAAVVDGAGSLYVAWQDERATPGVDQVFFTRSDDGGTSFRTPIRVSDGPDAAPSFTPAIAVDEGGHVAISYTTMRDPAEPGLADVYVAISSDGGGTFAPSRRATSRSFDVTRAASGSDGVVLGERQGIAPVGAGFRPLFAAALAKSPGSSLDQVDIWTTLVVP